MVNPLCIFVRFRQWGLFFLITASTFMLTGCHDTAAHKNNGATNVSVIPVKTAPVKFSKNFVVRTSATDSVDLLARVQGYITQRNFKEGSLVKKGQLLYKIDPTEFKIAVDKSQAQLESDKAKSVQAQKNLERGKALIKKKLISQENYDGLLSTVQQDKATVAVSQAALDQAKLNLSYTNITAPFDGMIGQTHYHVGSLVGPSEAKPLSEITSTNPMYVTFQVNEQDFLKNFSHKADQQVLNSHLVFELTLSDGTLYPEHGALNFISPTVNTDTDTITLRASFPNPKDVLLPGMYATMSVTNSQPKLLPEVPQIAIQHGKDGAFVYVTTNGKVQEKVVSLGPQVGTLQSILKGIKAGDQVVVQGLLKIREGQTVKVTELQLDAQGNIIPVSKSDSTKQSG